MRPEKRVVIVGAGFAGYNAARELSSVAGTTEIVVINSSGPECRRLARNRNG
jgi:NADH dehydrogenase FAD-containing subunit